MGGIGIWMVTRATGLSEITWRDTDREDEQVSMKPGASVHRLGGGHKAWNSDWKSPLVRQEEKSQFEGRRSFRKEAMVNTQSYREQETEVTTDWIVHMDTVDRDENSLKAATGAR